MKHQPSSQQGLPPELGKLICDYLAIPHAIDNARMRADCKPEECATSMQELVAEWKASLNTLFFLAQKCRNLQVGALDAMYATYPGSDIVAEEEFLQNLEISNRLGSVRSVTILLPECTPHSETYEDVDSILRGCMNVESIGILDFGKEDDFKGPSGEGTPPSSVDIKSFAAFRLDLAAVPTWVARYGIHKFESLRDLTITLPWNPAYWPQHIRPLHLAIPRRVERMTLLPPRGLYFPGMNRAIPCKEKLKCALRVFLERELAFPRFVHLREVVAVDGYSDPCIEECQGWTVEKTLDGGAIYRRE